MGDDRFTPIRKEFDRVGETDEHGIMLRLCLDIVVYYEGLFPEHAAQILQFYETALPYVRDHITYYDVDARIKPKKATAKAFELLPLWAREINEERLLHGMALESGRKPGEHGQHAFYFYQLGTVLPGFVRLILPIDTLREGAERFADLAIRLIGDMKFLCGSAGFSVNKYGFTDVAGIRALSSRYQGVDFAEPYTFRTWISDGISSVNWLTLIGTRLLARLRETDPVAALRAVLGEAMPVRKLKHGILVQAGEAPGFGEIERGETLSHYHSVGRALRELRIPTSALGRSNSIGGNHEHTVRWLARFDE